MRTTLIAILAGLSILAGCSNRSGNDSTTTTAKKIDSATILTDFTKALPPSFRTAGYMPQNLDPTAFSRALIDYCHDKTASDSATAIDNLMATVTAIIEKGGTDPDGANLIAKGMRTDIRTAADTACG